MQIMEQSDIMPSDEVIMRVLDVKPYHYAIYCTLEGHDGAIKNDIVHRSWTEDGKRILWGLETGNAIQHETYDMALDLEH